MKKKIALLKLALATPALSLISCGIFATKTNADETSFKVAIPYYSYSSSYKAISQIVDGYNNLIAGELTKEGSDYIPATTVSFADSYAGNDNHITNLLRSGSYSNLPSVTWGHTSILSTIASYGRELELSKIDNSDVLDDFRALNRRIQGLNPKKTWVVNTGNSGQVNSVNGPLLGYVIKQFLQKGAVLSKDKEQQKFFKDIDKISKKDEFVVKEILGKITTDEQVLRRIKGFVIDTRNWSNLVELLEFANLIKDAFPKYNCYVVGFDDPVNLIFSLLYSDLELDDSRFPIRVESKDSNDIENQNLVYKDIFDSNSESYKLFKKYFELLQGYAQKRVLWFPERERLWVTEKLKNHLLFFGIMSTAGYEFSYVEGEDFLAYRDKPGEAHFSEADGLILANLDKHSQLLKRLKFKNFEEISQEPAQPNQIAYMLLPRKKEIVRVFSFDQDSDLPKEFKDKEIYLESEFLKSLAKALAEDKFIAYQPDKKLFTNLEKSAIFEDVRVITKKGERKGSFAILPRNPEIFGQESTLQIEELFAIQPPRRLSKETPYQTVYFQGPVVFGISVSEKLDKNTIRFLNFYLNQAKWFYREGDKLVEVNQTPADYFAEKANYVYNTFSKLSKPIPPQVDNRFFRVTFNEFSSIALKKLDKGAIFKEPGSALVSVIRDALKTAIGQISRADYSFEDLIAIVKRATDSN